MPTVIEFPHVVETFHRALNEVLSPYLSTGNSVALQGKTVNFYHCDLFYNIDKLVQTPNPGDLPAAWPIICFTGTRIGNARTLKCHDPQNIREFGYETRADALRTVYVGVQRNHVLTLPPYGGGASIRLGNMMDADRIWSQLLLVMEYSHKDFMARNIFTPQLSSVPVQDTHKDYFLLRGEAKFEIRYGFTRQA